MEDSGGPLAEAEQPDVMNDPTLDTRLTSSEKGREELDTCRICRGEGSKEEPLFYPCKCSGSIKFVHQNCLMEWLSHSQKKHCELCKTPFHFTKLYSPHMPNTVPVLVFMRQAILHTYRNILSWWRLQLVLFVWAMCLPYGMRSVWRALFWLGDGGWVKWQEVERRATVSAQQYMDRLAATGTSPADLNHFTSRSAAASAVVSHVANTIPSILAPLPSFNFNYAGNGPLLFRLGKKLVRAMASRISNESINIEPTLPIANRTTPTRLETGSSLLSDVAFLKTLTRYPRLNNILIDMFEGQIITLSIVVAFILVFLIREWVVQQQPAMAMAAVANAAAQNAQAAVLAAEDAHEDMQPRVDSEQDQSREQQATDTSEDGPEDVEPALEPRPPRILARVRQRRQEIPLEPEPDAHDLPQQLELMNTSASSEEQSAQMQRVDDSATRDNDDQSNPEASIFASSSSDSRPSMPAKGSLDQTAEIRRTLEEISVSVGQKDWPGLKIFMDLWNRAGKSPSEVLQIIDREGRTEELGWIVAAMKGLENEPTTESGEDMTKTDTENHVTNENKAPEELPVEDRSRSLSPFSPKEGFSLEEDMKPPADVDNGDFAATQPSGENRPKTSTENIQSSKTLLGEFDMSLKDISNQQLDGSNDYPPSQSNETDDSFVVVSHESGTNPTSNDLPEENPFHPDYDGPLPPSQAEHLGKSADVPSTEIITYLDHQEQNITNIIEEGDNSIREASLTHGLGDNGDALNLPSDTATNDANPPRGYLEAILEWLWGAPPSSATQRDTQEVDEEHIVERVEAEAPFVPMAQGRPVFEADEAQNPNPAPAVQVPQAEAAADEALLDPNGAEVVEEGEDLEGILELVGMQGPIFALVQNAIFCSVIVALTIGVGIWIPYISGKLFLIFLTNPISLLFKLPLRWISMTADTVVDICIFTAGCLFYWTDTAISFLCRPVTQYIPQLALITEKSSLAEVARQYAEGALNRLAKTMVSTSGSFLESDVPTFSVVAHESLIAIQDGLSMSVKTAFGSLVNLFNVSSTHEMTEHVASVALGFRNSTFSLADSLAHGFTDLKSSAQSLSLEGMVQVNLTIPQRAVPLDFTLAVWGSKDRTLAILTGYMFFALMGVIYLQIGASFRGRNAAGRVNGSLADALYQAGGVTKVILIISIEMILFPLFCGLLLDIALLPLFGNVTFMSRLDFSLAAPYTSLFIHWFIGTCYMFHFALFVSMCRKLMRTGVLYFIRDPDDPTFHPVRDVLERNLFTQLRKIIFSAVVYGALVMICLGGVVWGIYYAFDGVFPIHWSPNEPILEFPVDLLFYNFLMPVAVKFFGPSSALNRIYGWWFRRCARALRLSHFLFGDKKEDEEGRHVRRKWRDVFEGKLGDPSKPVTNLEQQSTQDDQVSDAYFLRDGRYVRAPASDSVRMPRGTRTFLEVDEHNKRLDKLDDPEQGPHGSKNDQFTQVYVPPWFRLRISTFIFLIWLFTAALGVSTTLLPLIVGRSIFARLTPSHLRTNDIYAFSIGVYAIGGTAYTLLYTYIRLGNLRTYITTSTAEDRTRSLFGLAKGYAYRALRICYTYMAFTILLPALFALLVQTYAIIPLHTYFGIAEDRHTIHIVQDWTLGVLYIQAIGRLILFYSPSRPADSLRDIVRNGWLDPDARLATRAFIFPGTLLMLFLLAVPLTLGRVVSKIWYHDEEEMVTKLVYRYSAPALLGLAVLAMALGMLKNAFLAWRRRIRDEVYLIGERLHNFGESRKVGRAAAGGRLAVRA